jgi:large subunit ribosomal protein L9
MKVILLEDDTKLGDKGSIVDVAKGFAKNFLIPFKKAAIATKSNISVMANAMNMTKKKVAKEQKSHQDLADKLRDISLDFKQKSGATGHLYGTITTEQIV